MSSRVRSRNAYETQLDGTISAGDTSFNVDSASGLTAPLYLVIDPEDPVLREYILVGSVGATSMSSVTRGVDGSASGAQGHSDGAVVRAVAVHQWLDLLFTDIEALETSTAAHYGGTLTSDHPEVTTSVRGFMSAADKTKLDGIATGAQADHDSLSGVSSDDHHAQVHDIQGADHIASGLSAGHVLRATGTSTFGFGSFDHSFLGSVSADQHHNEDHESRHDAGGADELSAWANGGYTPGATVQFTSGGSFTKASYPGLRAVKVRVQAAGGAGGGAAATTGSQGSVGAGGAGGGYSEAFVLASALAASETVTVGTGGAGASSANGAAGGNSAFGTFATADGGPGGGFLGAASSLATHAGTARPSAGTGDLALPGTPGGGAVRLGAGQLLSGQGGPALLGGGGGYAQGSSAAGQIGGLYGGGGGGAVNTTSQSARAGGDGRNGIVLVELFF